MCLYQLYDLEQIHSDFHLESLVCTVNRHRVNVAFKLALDYCVD